MMLRLTVFQCWSIIACVLLKSEAAVAWIGCHHHHLKYQPQRNRIHSTLPKANTRLQRTPILHSSLVEESLFVPDTFVPLILIVALSLGFAANGWINQLLTGKEKKSGLGAFLRDGSGYNRSGFAMQDSDRAVQSDPMPWLKLPKFDFVEVAGQETPDLEDTLEKLRLDLNVALKNGDRIEAKRIERQLEDIMKKAGIEFQSDTQESATKY